MRPFSLVVSSYKFGFVSLMRNFFLSLCIVMSFNLFQIIPYILNSIAMATEGGMLGDLYRNIINYPVVGWIFRILIWLPAMGLLLFSIVASISITINAIRIGFKLYYKEHVHLSELFKRPTALEIVQMAVLIVVSQLLSRLSHTTILVMDIYQWLILAAYAIILIFVARFILAPFIFLDKRVNLIAALRTSWRETAIYWLETILMVAFFWIFLIISSSLTSKVVDLLYPIFKLNIGIFMIIVVSLSAFIHFISTLVQLWSTVYFYKQIMK